VRRGGAGDATLDVVGTQAVTLFFALLTVVAALGTGLIGLAAATGRTATARRLAGPSALALAGLVALTATLGSLYYSEVAGFAPCQLCWYQRIAMYPLPVVLGIAAWRKDFDVRHYVVPLAAIGAVVAGYHYQLEWFPGQRAVACAADVPCDVAWFRSFGFISLPLMALVAFVCIVALVAIAAPPRPSRADDVDRSAP
jgi:disulfide bond formation protein DsbB